MNAKNILPVWVDNSIDLHSALSFCLVAGFRHAKVAGQSRCQESCHDTAFRECVRQRAAPAFRSGFPHKAGQATSV